MEILQLINFLVEKGNENGKVISRTLFNQTVSSDLREEVETSLKKQDIVIVDDDLLTETDEGKIEEIIKEEEKIAKRKHSSSSTPVFTLMLREHMKYKRLSKEEMAFKWNVVKKGKNAQRILDGTKKEELSDEEITNLNHYVLAGEEARKLLVISHYPLVIKIMLDFQKKGKAGKIAQEDLFNEGMLALNKVSHTFDMNFGVLFETYSFRYVWDAISSLCSSLRNSISVPNTAASQRQQVFKIISQYQDEHNGKLPNYQEIADLWNGCPTKNKASRVKKVIDLINSSNAAIDLDKPIDDTKSDGSSDTTLERYIPSEAISPETLMLRKKCHDRLIEILDDVLTEREKSVLILHSGMNQNSKSYTFEEIAPIYNITRERARQLYHEAAKKVKDSQYYDELLSLMQMIANK